MKVPVTIFELEKCVWLQVDVTGAKSRDAARRGGGRRGARAARGAERRGEAELALPSVRCPSAAHDH